MISPGWECRSDSGNGGEMPSQTLQMPTCTLEQERTMELARVFPSHFLIVFPGLVAIKATTTMTVFANREEMATEKMTLKAVCRRRQVTLWGWPMNRKGDKKQKRREPRRP